MRKLAFLVALLASVSTLAACAGPGTGMLPAAQVAPHHDSMPFLP